MSLLFPSFVLGLFLGAWLLLHDAFHFSLGKCVLLLLPAMCAFCVWYIGLPPVKTPGYSLGYYFGLGVSESLGLLCLRGDSTSKRIYLVATYLMGVAVLAFLGPLYYTFHEAEVAARKLPVSTRFSQTSCPETIKVALLAHISDSHVTDKGQPTYEGTEAGNATLEGSLLPQIAGAQPSYLVISGDITDSGTDPEWHVAMDLLSGVKARVILSPGNHDIIPAYESSLDEDGRAAESEHYLIHLIRFIEAEGSMFPELHTGTGSILGTFLTKVPPPPTPERIDGLNAVMDGCVRNCQSPEIRGLSGGCQIMCQELHDRSLVQDQIRFIQPNAVKLFPLSWIDESKHLAILSLATTISDDSRLAASAIGYIGAPQLKRLKSMIESFPPTITTIVVVCHHAQTRVEGESASIPPRSQWLSIGAWQDSLWWAFAYLRMDERQANMLMEYLQNVSQTRGTRVFLLVGHRHRLGLTRYHNVIIGEAPSVAGESPVHGFFLLSDAVPAECALVWHDVQLVVGKRD